MSKIRGGKMAAPFLLKGIGTVVDTI